MPEDCHHIKLEVAYNNWVLSCLAIISLLFPLSTLDQFHSTVIQTNHSTVIQTTQVYMYIYGIKEKKTFTSKYFAQMLLQLSVTFHFTSLLNHK